MLLDAFLQEVNENSATDLYLVAGAVPCLNRDGQFMAVKASKMQRVTPQQMEEFARYLMNESQWEAFCESRECNLAHMSEKAGRYRVNIFWQRGSIAIVMRRIIMDIPTLKQLGLPPVLRDIALADRGIILVTGATGSGKSTTMASMLDYRNHVRTGHIISIEDPVEFVYQHRRSIVTQREVGIDTLSFQEALRNSLRQAPQVISIGELRDAETVKFAMHASETGHLVFATLHSTNAPLTVERVLNFYPGNHKEQVQIQLSLNLKAIISQRLIRNVQGGRVAAVEVLINTPRISDLVAKGDQSELKQSMGAENEHGIVNFAKSLFRLTKRGFISKEDALLAADSANDLELKFRGIGITPGSSWDDLSDPWQYVGGEYDPPATWLRSKGAPAAAPPPPRQAAAQPAREDLAPPTEVPQGSYSNDGVPKLSTNSPAMSPPTTKRSTDSAPRPSSARHTKLEDYEANSQSSLSPNLEPRIPSMPPPPPMQDDGLDELD